MTDKFISIEGIAKRFPAPGGGTTTVFEDLWLAMQRGEFVCIIGHSGCGKTTVLNILAGLDAPTEGTVIVDNQAIEGPSLDRAVIFQSHALLPWRTVMGNVAYAVSSKWRSWGGAESRRAGAEIHRPRRPDRRRAQAPGRALRRHEAARRHRARALDRAQDHADGRAVLRARCAHARHPAGRGAPHLQETGQTVFMITHDVDEAIYLADRIVLMTNGPDAVLAEIVENPLPKDAQRNDVHKHPLYYGVRNHIIDFLVTRSKSFADEMKRPPSIRASAGGAAGRAEPTVARRSAARRRALSGQIQGRA